MSLFAQGGWFFNEWYWEPIFRTLKVLPFLGIVALVTAIVARGWIPSLGHRVWVAMGIIVSGTALTLGLGLYGAYERPVGALDAPVPRRGRVARPATELRRAVLPADRHDASAVSRAARERRTSTSARPRCSPTSTRCSRSILRRSSSRGPDAEWPHGLRPLRRPRADPPHRPRLRRGRGGARGRGARPREALPLRDRRQARRPRPHGHPVPRGVRRRRRRHARLRARRRGAHARRLVGGDHDVRAHLARHPADLPVRLRGAEARVAAGADRGAQARRVRADRARGGLRRRQRPHARPAGQRRLGHQRRQAVHHQRGHRHLGRRLHHRPDRRRRDLEPDRGQRHARLRAGRAVPQDGLERVRHAPADVHRLPRPGGQPARPARPGLQAVPAHPRHRAHRRRRHGRRARAGGARPGASPTRRSGARSASRSRSSRRSRASSPTWRRRSRPGGC